MLVAAVNALQEAGLPLALVMCGLPTLRANLQRARTYSERMFRGEHIGELEGNPGPARDAFVEPLKETGLVAEEALIARVLDEVEGCPFFIQLWEPSCGRQHTTLDSRCCPPGCSTPSKRTSTGASMRSSMSDESRHSRPVSRTFCYRPPSATTPSHHR
ncbi:MAG: hypothetical protein WKF76_08920 [Nocardioidaceae bacterium]